MSHDIAKSRNSTNVAVSIYLFIEIPTLPYSAGLTILRGRRILIDTLKIWFRNRYLHSLIY